MKGKPGDEIRLRHILEAITNIENFSAGKSKEHLYSEPMYRFSVERQLEIINNIPVLKSEVEQILQNISF